MFAYECRSHVKDAKRETWYPWVRGRGKKRKKDNMVTRRRVLIRLRSADELGGK